MRVSISRLHDIKSLTPSSLLSQEEGVTGVNMRRNGSLIFVKDFTPDIYPEELVVTAVHVSTRSDSSLK